jgi:DNA modification methylase
MNGKIANMLFTSPPYNAGENVYDPTSKVTKGKYEAYDDDIDPNEWKSLVNDTLTVWRQFTEYQFMNIQQLAGNKKSFWQFASDNSDYLADVSVWNKGHTAPAYATNVMNSSFEFVLIFAQKENPSRAISTANFRGTVSNVLDMGGQRSNEFSHVHSATFPVAMTEHYITSFTSSNSIICDSFNGVGTTLIASEKNNRLYYGMEIDPLYVDCTVIRWQEYTGKYAVLESTGETYNRSVPRGTIVE